MNGIADFLNFTKDVGQNFYQNVLADPSTYSFQKNPNEFNLRDVTDFIFDPDDPIDKASLALLLFPPAFGAARIGQTLRKGGKLTSALKSGIADPKIGQRVGAFIGYPFLADEASAMTRGIGLRGDEYSGILSKDTLDTISKLGEEYMDDPELVNAILAAQLTGKDFTEYLSDSKKEIMGLKNGGIASFKKGGTIIKGLDDILKKIDEAKKPKTKKPDPKKPDPKKTDPKASTKKSQEALDQTDKKPRIRVDASGKPILPGPPKPQTGSPKPTPKKDKPKTDSDVKPGSGEVPKRGGMLTDNIITRNPIKSALGAGFIAANLGINPLRIGDSFKSDEGVVSGSGVNLGDNLGLIGLLNQNLKDSDYDPTRDQTLQGYVNQVLTDKGISNPSFLDYISALPQGYANKVGDDPSFAKKMMAGFLNMMKPQAGIVPISAPVAFGEGFLGEETRQADMLPSDVKTLQFLRANPGLMQDYLNISRARSGVTVGDLDPGERTERYFALVQDLAIKQNISADQLGNYRVVFDGVPVDPTIFGILISQNADIMSDPRFSLALKETVDPG